MSYIKDAIDYIMRNRIVAHILFWFCFVLLCITLAMLNGGNPKESLIRYLVFLPCQALACYSLLYVQVPHLLLRKKYLLFTTSLLFTFYIFSALARLSSIYIAEPLFRENFTQESVVEVLANPLYLAFIYFPTVYVIVFLFVGIKVIKDRINERHHLEIVKGQKTATELKFLKAQIQPHFLFNTLNNLYSLALTKSEQTAEVILKLSDVMDYVLYKCNEKRVPLRNEITFLEDYIDLERLRYDEDADIVFEHHSDNDALQIAPLILISFVENAFKYCASSESKGLKVKVELESSIDQLTFRVYNTQVKSSIGSSAGSTHGIGHMNTLRQLEINYKNMYNLEISNMDDSYEINLTIKIEDSYV